MSPLYHTHRFAKVPLPHQKTVEIGGREEAHSLDNGYFTKQYFGIAGHRTVNVHVCAA